MLVAFLAVISSGEVWDRIWFKEVRIEDSTDAKGPYLFADDEIVAAFSLYGDADSPVPLTGASSVCRFVEILEGDFGRDEGQG